MSVTKICEDGKFDVVCRRDKAYIVDRQNHKTIGEFTKKGGLYVAEVKVRNPLAPGFHRPE